MLLTDPERRQGGVVVEGAVADPVAKEGGEGPRARAAQGGGGGTAGGETGGGGVAAGAHAFGRGAGGGRGGAPGPHGRAEEPDTGVVKVPPHERRPAAPAV